MGKYIHAYKITGLFVLLLYMVPFTQVHAANVYSLPVRHDTTEVQGKTGREEQSRSLVERKSLHGQRTRGWRAGVDRVGLARILGLTPAQLEAEQRRGSSIAEIAQKRGIGEEELLRRLKEEMTDDLKRMIHRQAPRTFERSPSDAKKTAAE